MLHGCCFAQVGEFLDAQSTLFPWLSDLLPCNTSSPFVYDWAKLEEFGKQLFNSFIHLRRQYKERGPIELYREDDRVY